MTEKVRAKKLHTKHDQKFKRTVFTKSLPNSTFLQEPYKSESHIWKPVLRTDYNSDMAMCIETPVMPISRVSYANTTVFFVY